MTLGKHLGINLFFALIAVCFFFLYSEFVLIDSVVPVEGITIEDWLASYESAGIVACIVGIVISLIWFFIGNGFSGGSAIAVEYLALFIVSFVLGGATNFMVESSIEGGSVAKFVLPIMSALIYYLTSLFASADSVKFVPPLSGKLH